MYNNNILAQSQYQPQYQMNRPIYPTLQQPYMGIKGRPVASIEEVRGSIIDFDGSTYYFPDMANQKIYTKQINADGTATLRVYELKETPTEEEQSFIPRSEFEAALEALRQSFTVPVPQTPATKPSSGISLNF